MDNTVSRATDKTKDRSEVAEFLVYYPNANVTVYFVTTCATESCETLIRVPATVEYLYEITGKLALLRIGLETRLDGEPNYAEASCRIIGGEFSVAMAGKYIEYGRITDFLQNDERCPQSPPD
ncbi:MAG: hypothetical protein QXJ74_02350 [Nitrososphaera sp.]